MRRLVVLLTVLALTCALTACGKTETQNGSGQSRAPQAASPASDQDTPSAPSVQEDEGSGEETTEGSVLVAYFSATGNTERIALQLQDILDADLYEIVPEVPYTDEDLNYSDDSCRANQEQNDPAARPAIAGTLENPGDYDVVFLGYPIWWGQAPRIMDTFLERYDFEGVTLVPFCTSGSSGIDGSLDGLRPLAPGATWLDGRRFSGGTSRDTVAAWVAGLDLPASPSVET